MINKLISKTQVRLLEYDGNPSQDYKDGYCRAINDVLDLEPIPTLGADEYEKFKADYKNRLKADLKAILVELQMDVEGQKFDTHMDKDVWNDAIRVCSDLIQQRINELKGKV